MDEFVDSKQTLAHHDDLQPRVALAGGAVRVSAVRAVAFIDPYWISGESALPSSEVLRSITRAAGARVRIQRVYWYVEQEGARSACPSVPRVTIRHTATDDIDDGYELVRAIDADVRAAAASRAYDAVIISSFDDRLALTLEWVKSQGITVLGCVSHTDEADQRMLRVVDELLEVSTRGHDASDPRARDADAVGDGAVQAIDAAVSQWRDDTDADTTDRTRQFVSTRPGLPRLVDSRLLFLTSKQLGRELSASERVLLRKTLREKLTAT